MRKVTGSNPVAPTIGFKFLGKYGELSLRQKTRRTRPQIAAFFGRTRQRFVAGVRAFASHAKGHRFESYIVHHYYFLNKYEGKYAYSHQRTNQNFD